MQFDAIPGNPLLESLGRNNGVTFTVDAGMHSTGSGMVEDRFKRLCSLYLVPGNDAAVQIFLPNQAIYSGREVALTSRPISTPGNEKTVNGLMKRSAIVSNLVWMNALSHVASAGLPGLGKRR